MVMHLDVEPKKSFDLYAENLRRNLEKKRYIPYLNDYLEEKVHFQHSLNHFSYYYMLYYQIEHLYDDDEKDEMKLDIVVLEEELFQLFL